jgi:hypothetical protein
LLNFYNYIAVSESAVSGEKGLSKKGLNKKEKGGECGRKRMRKEEVGDHRGMSMVEGAANKS